MRWCAHECGAPGGARERGAPEASVNAAHRGRAGAVYALMVAVGLAAFLYPFWLPAASLPDQAHAGDAPLVAAVAGVLVVGAVLMELRAGTMTGITVALLGVLSAMGGLLRLLDLPGGGSGIFFLVLLAAAAFGPRFGLLLGMLSMAVSAVVTGGIGPWLPFQMICLGWLGAGAGFVGRGTRRLPERLEVAVLATYGWASGFVFGAVMNLWFWPFQVGEGELAWNPSLGVRDTLVHYWRFYVATSLGWDAAGAIANAVVIALCGGAVLASLRRFSSRLEPVVRFTSPPEAMRSLGTAVEATPAAP